MALIADAAYLFDEKKRLLRPIVWGLYELIHAEASYTLDAEIDMKYGAKPGQHIGFEDIDGRFLLFEIDEAEDDASKGTTIITATDAAVAELAHQVTREVRLTGTDAKTAATKILSGSGFALGTATKGQRTADVGIYYEKRWKKLKELESAFGVRVVAYFTVKDGTITGRYVDILERTYENAGILYERETGTSNVYVTYSNAPITRMYGVGKSTGTEDPPSCVTFRDLVWSKANGDPADKPAGQDYIEDADAVAQFGNGREDVYTSKYEEDGKKLLEDTWAELQKRKKPSVSGSASASDLEHVPGHEHKRARMYCTVSVRTKRGDTVEAVIIDIKRNYLRPSLTKITIGEEKTEENNDLIKKVASVSESARRSSGSGSAAANRYIETKQLIQLNAETIQMNARLIEANAEEIALTASNLERYQAGTDETLNEVSIDMNALEAEMLLKASVEYVDGRNDEVYIQLDAMDKEIELKADKITLNGYVTAKQLETEFTNFESGISDNLYVSDLSASRFECSSFDFKGNGMSLKRTDYVKSAERTKRYALSPSNTTIEFWEISSIDNGTLYYMSWE